MAKTALLRIRNAAQVVCVCSNGERVLRGPEQRKVAIVENGSVVVGLDGRVLAVGPATDIERDFAGWTFEADVDATGKVVMPGFVDAHTHPIWSGDRVHEFAMKLAGATYMEVHKAGGGIGFTVRHTRASSQKELADLLNQRLDRMLRCGTTIAEGKSGYGLDTESEIKQLRVLHESKHTVEIVSTFLGAHSVPSGMTAAQGTKAILEEMIPAVAEAMKRGEISPKFVDVFMEEGVYGYDDSKAILLAGKAIGLDINFHGDELHYVKAGELAGEIGALAISHLEELSDAGIQAMTIRPTFAVLLPTTAYLMHLKAPPARKLIAAGVPVALGSDYNPNAHCLSMPFVMNLACVTLGMTMEESLVACTINAAGSIGVADNYGSLEVGKWGDMFILDAPRWEHIIYEISDPQITHVFKKGKLACKPCP